MRSLTIGIVLALCLASAVVVVSDDADAVPTCSESYYIYSNDLTLWYDGGTQDIDSLVWIVDGYKDGSYVDSEENTSASEPWEYTVDRTFMERCDEVYVTQTIHKEGASASETYRMTILADVDDDDMIVVTFHDGYSGNVVGDPGFFHSSKVVRYGDAFVSVPDTPEREGYDFVGWFYGSDMDRKFDPYAPVTEDVDVYAKWSPVTSGGTSGSVNVGSHIVTFDCSPGLTYTLLDSGNGRVSFTVSELPDYQVIEGSIEVEANGNPVSPVDGVYIVTGINTDVLITIDGDLMFSGNPNDPASDDGGMPMWMWIMLVVVILLIAAAILWMRGRQVDQGRI